MPAAGSHSAVDDEPGATSPGQVVASGAAIARGPRLMRLAAPPKVLVLTTFDLDKYVYAAMRAGASGFLLKDVPREQLVAGVRVVAGGESLLTPAITRRLVEAFVRLPPPGSGIPKALSSSLTAREVEVLRLLARGASNAEIAHTLVLGEATVKTHVARVLRKLGLRDRVQAVVTAYETGLVQPGSDRSVVAPE